MDKKRVQSSHLALRFYKHDGWTKEVLEKYLKRGRVIDQFHDQEARDYYWLDHEQSSQFDMVKLFENEVSEVTRWYDYDGPLGYLREKESDLEYMKRFNW